MRASTMRMKKQEREFDWPTYLSEDDRQQLQTLYDEVARHEATHGYAGSLANEIGRSIVDAEADALAKGQIHMLLARDVDGLAGSLILEPYKSHSRKHTLYAKRAVIARRARGTFLPSGRRSRSEQSGRPWG